MLGPRERSPAEVESLDFRQGLRLSQSLRERFPPVWPVGDGVGTLITCLVILHSDWSSGLRNSSVAPHCWFLHSLSLRVTNLFRRLTSAFRAGSLVIYHCLRRRVFRRISSGMPAGIGARGSSRWRPLGLEAARAFKTTPEKFLTHVSIETSL
jgi:hypothetical protein